MERLRVIRRIDGKAVSYVREGHDLDALVTVERNEPGKLLALLRVREPGDGVTIHAAAERRLVELPDGRSAKLFAIPSAGHCQGQRARVEFPTGAVASYPADALRLVDVIEVSS